MTMNKIKALALALLPALAVNAQAKGLTDNTELKLHIGYNIGGTAPVGMPASIRRLNSYTLQPNLVLGVEADKALDEHWGLTLGLQIENKGMKEDARVKNYHEEVVRGGEKLAGMFTGDVTTEVTEWMLTIPLHARWQATNRFSLHAGPYLSILTQRKFTGYAHDGYLRVGDPTGAKVILGGDESTRGDYDFSDDMRHLQWGVDVGGEYRIWQRTAVFANLSWGLSGIHHSGFTAVEQTLYPIYASVGVSYRLKQIMKKTLLSLALALLSSLSMSANDYTETLVVTVNGTATRQTATISVDKNNDGTYNFNLKNFMLKMGKESMGIGNITLNNLKAAKSDKGEVVSTHQNITIKKGDDPNVDTWMGPMLGTIPLDLKLLVNNEKLYTISCPTAGLRTIAPSR